MKRIDLPNLDDVVERYLAGATSQQLADELGVSPQTILRNLKRAGVPTRPAHTIRTVEIPEEIVTRYQSGDSAMTLAREFGIHEALIRRELRERGIVVRPRSDYSTNMEPAHNAARGRRHGLDERLLRSATNEREVLHASEYEVHFSGLLIERGVEHVPQRQIGPYNVDLAVAELPIAVEIRGGNGGSHREPRRTQRLEYILGEGWSLLEVLVRYGRFTPVTGGSADYLVAWLDELRRNPSARCEHRVVRANGEPYTGERLYFHQRP